MRKVVAVVLTLVIAIVAACAAGHAPQPIVPEAQPDATSWAWYTDAGYTWYTPGRGWAWVETPRAPPARPRPLFGSVAPPSTFQYVPPTIDADHGLLVLGAGYISNVHCVLTVAASDAGVPLYIMGVDTSSSAQPTNGTVPIYGVVSGAMASAGNDVTFSDTAVPSTISFTNGLMLALSSTADTFTAPTAGNQIRCDAKVRGS